MKSTAKIEKESYEKMKKDYGYKNAMAAPRLVKVSVSSGIGSLIKKDKNKGEFVSGRLSKITGQRPVARAAKKAIATFKTREGDTLGYLVTMRGQRMHSFVDKLLNIALPRTKDFRGISRDSVDAVGNLTIGIKENNIFPETSEEELKDVFGFAVTLVSTAKNKKEALEFFELLGVPFKKPEAKKAK
ncbi:MAG: 50S ribosomal protein L5 [Candidatus Paceibacterota bacterium]|jgi:large subunit ribosomal protein L5